MSPRLLTAAFALTVIAPWSAATFSTQGGGHSANPVFARRVAGTYAEVWSGESILTNIRADGTLDWSGSYFFGGTGDYYAGPVFGSWRQTGSREMTTIELGHIFDEDGEFLGTGRVQQVFTFDANLESVVSLVWTQDNFGRFQNPTDPDEVPQESFSGAGGPMHRLLHPR